MPEPTISPAFIAGIQAVLDMMDDAGTLRERRPGAIRPESNGYSCWMTSDEGADHEKFSTAPLRAEEIAERYERWMADATKP